MDKKAAKRVAASIITLVTVFAVFVFGMGLIGLAMEYYPKIAIPALALSLVWVIWYTFYCDYEDSPHDS